MVLAAVFPVGKGRGTRGAAVAEGSTIEGLRILNREGGSLLWSFNSKRAVLSEDGGSAQLEDVSVLLHSRDIRVESEQGFYEMKSRDLKLSGGVKAESAGYVFKTDTLQLLKGTAIFTDDKVMVEGKDAVIEGKGLRAKQNVWVIRDVKATLY